MRNQVYRKFLILIGLGVYSFLVADYVERKTLRDIVEFVDDAQPIKLASYSEDSTNIAVLPFESYKLPDSYTSIIEESDEEEPFDINSVIKLGKRYNIAHLDIVIAQMIEESANLKSNLYKTQNNMFGMKVAKSRPTTAIGSNKYGYAKYRDPEMSLLDYALYQAAFNRTRDRKVYLQRLGSSYAHAPGYVQRLEAIIKIHNLKSRCL